MGAGIPNELVKVAERIPSDWNTLPFSESTPVYGDEWLQGRESVALRVPSAVIPDDNILLNPAHEDFKALEIDESPIHWDPRLVK
jgi:RES domain-containing protein